MSERQLRRGLTASLVSVVVSPLLAIGKIVAGVVGHSYALVADGIESCADVFSSLVVWKALRVAARPADAEHPYGHGKAESLAGVVVAGGLLAAAALIALQSVREIVTPHHAPAPFTEYAYGLLRFAVDGKFTYPYRPWPHDADARLAAARPAGGGVRAVAMAPERSV